ncbi:MAG: sodium-independent anion transporter, partial [Gammaproteobacteria bacterium]|nr:sodium-independent anion transporter [Gammaproteobacteria bacterium]
MNLKRWLPCLDWAASYDKATAGKDGLAAVIVTLMLIPQSLAYAMLAGLPPITGLYASIAPLFLYAIFGSSRTLAVGPVAVISLMTAAALTPMFAAQTAEYVGAAMLLATRSGLMLLLMAVLRLGFLANFLSHPVISGFISASGLLIALSQLKHILGVQASGDTVLQLVPSLVSQIPYIHVPTLIIGGLCLLFLQLVRTRLKGFLLGLGCSKGWADSLTKTGPVLTIIVSVLAVTLGDLANSGVQVVGSVPEGLPVLRMPTMDMQLAIQLLPAALLISLVGFVESVSVAQTLAAKRRERIDPDQELVGLGTANIAAAVSGGFPVTGGFSRSIVNFDAGARTPMAGVLTAVGIAVTAMFFTPLFHNLPHAVLAATIIVAVLSLVDFKSLKRTWRFSKQDFIAQAATMIGVLFMGVE